MTAMRLSHGNKISARLPRQLREAVEDAVKLMQRKGIKYGERKIGIEGVASAAILEFFDRPIEEQVVILERRVYELEVMLGEKEPTLEIASAKNDLIKGEPGNVFPKPVEPSPPRTGSKRRPAS